MSMIEKVARAMLAHRMPNHPSLVEERYWNTYPNKELYLNLAKAAIEAMSEPTDEMIEQLDASIRSKTEAILAWQATIDAALKE